MTLQNYLVADMEAGVSDSENQSRIIFGGIISEREALEIKRLWFAMPREERKEFNRIYFVRKNLFDTPVNDRLLGVIE